MLDLRLPIGMMFSLVGGLLVIYGLVTTTGQCRDLPALAGHQRQFLVGPGARGIRPGDVLLQPPRCQAEPAGRRLPMELGNAQELKGFRIAQTMLLRLSSTSPSPPMSCRLLIDPPAPGAWNMAVDEVLLETAARWATVALRFYRWSEPTLSLGYFQEYADRFAHRAEPPRGRGAAGSPAAAQSCTTTS